MSSNSEFQRETLHNDTRGPSDESLCSDHERTPEIPTITSSAEPRDFYIDLLKRALINWLYSENSFQSFSWTGRAARFSSFLARLANAQLVTTYKFDAKKRVMGEDFPMTAHTMVGWKRLTSLQFCVETVIRDGIPGDLIETGVWRGGSCILMRGILLAHGVTNRTVWVADSFAGVPKPRNSIDAKSPAGELYKADGIAVSEDEVRDNFGRYGLLDDQVCFLKGWFKDTLPTAPFPSLSVARLDGDLYESTMDALIALYPKLSPGGFLIVDDYNIAPTCKQAVQEYRKANGIHEPIVEVDRMGVYWRKTKQ